MTQNQSHASSRRMHQYGIARFNLAGAMKQIMRRHSLHQQSCHLLVVKSVGKMQKFIGRIVSSALYHSFNSWSFLWPRL
ncbi:MAG: hypothetical protein OXC66_03085, partial [Roseovarius sp.]|nr:hypothetical protein [Roseovarius sp.]